MFAGPCRLGRNSCRSSGRRQNPRVRMYRRFISICPKLEGAGRCRVLRPTSRASPQIRSRCRQPACRVPYRSDPRSGRSCAAQQGFQRSELEPTVRHQRLPHYPNPPYSWWNRRRMQHRHPPRSSGRQDRRVICISEPPWSTLQKQRHQGSPDIHRRHGNQVRW